MESFFSEDVGLQEDRKTKLGGALKDSRVMKMMFNARSVRYRCEEGFFERVLVLT